MKRVPDPAGHREDGQVAGIEILPLALLVFVVGSLLLVNAWAVIDAKLAASDAAAATAQAYAEVPGGLDTAQAWQVASAAGQDAFDAAALPADRTRLRPRIEPGPTRCGRVVVEATVVVPRIVLPWIGGFGDGIEVRARHSRLVDPFRDGLDGTGCV